MEEQEEFSVTAVGSGRGGRGAQRGRGGQNRSGLPGRGGQRPQQLQPNSTQPAAAADTPAQLARQASGLCRSHFRYGDKAYSWGGN